MTEPDPPPRPRIAMEKIVAPWDDTTILALTAHQHSGRIHPYTCGLNGDHVLTPTRTGWVCEHDNYRQNWARPVDWFDIDPVTAADIALPATGIIGPLDDEGKPCPWPWEPQQRVGVPLGMYHCGYCGSMVVAGMPHPDSRFDQGGEW